VSGTAVGLTRPTAATRRPRPGSSGRGGASRARGIDYMANLQKTAIPMWRINLSSIAATCWVLTLPGHSGQPRSGTNREGDRRGNRKRCDRQAQSDAPNPLTATVASLIRARLSPQRHSCLSVPSVHHTSIKPMRSVTGASARQTATISRRVRRRRHPAFHADQVGV
jgi:hypothetical protein